jgi:hypothetical protein
MNSRLDRLQHPPVDIALEPILKWQKPRCYNGSMTNPNRSLTDLSDVALLIEVKTLVAREREATADLIASLAELDARRLYLGQGYSSLFTYCTQCLHLSEHAAYGRIEAARAARRWPIILELLSDGAITLTTSEEEARADRSASVGSNSEYELSLHPGSRQARRLGTRWWAVRVRGDDPPMRRAGLSGVSPCRPVRGRWADDHRQSPTPLPCS